MISTRLKKGHMNRLISIGMLIVLFPTVALSLKASPIKQPLPMKATVDKVLIEKNKRRLTLLNNNTPIKSYEISLGMRPTGKKTEEGDDRTPEGVYTIDRKNLKSSYHRALHISYPNTEDKAQSKARGVSPGGDIMIHGLPNGEESYEFYQTKRDWTAGCIAVNNAEIEEIFRVVPNGTIVEILP
jgi:murein L,D-transpeptidase YafK